MGRRSSLPNPTTPQAGAITSGYWVRWPCHRLARELLRLAGRLAHTTTRCLELTALGGALYWVNWKLEYRHVIRLTDDLITVDKGYFVPKRRWCFERRQSALRVVPSLTTGRGLNCLCTTACPRLALGTSSAEKKRWSYCVCSVRSYAFARTALMVHSRPDAMDRANTLASNAAKVGFISLGCPKALVDSERILTQLRTEGYQITPHYEDAGVVIVNTCGFIDAAKEESLEAIGEAIEENGRVLVTGCMGRGEDAETILARHPKVMGVSGPAAYEEVLATVREALPNNHRPDP